MEIKLILRTLILGMIFCQSNISHSQFRTQFAPLKTNNYLGFHFDDDFLFVGNRDEQYSGGFELEFLTSIKNSCNKCHSFNPFSEGERYLSMTIGGELYTPYNVSDSLIILNDRPYSSYLYTTIGYTAYSIEGDRKLNLDFYLGIMGSKLPGTIQGMIHTVGDSPPTHGWDNRLMEEEVFIPNIRLQYQRNMLTIGRIRPAIFDWFQISNSFVLNTGYFANNIGAGIKVNLSTALPLSPSKQTFKVNSYDVKVAKDLNKKTIWNIYFSSHIEFVGRNTSLQSLPWLISPYIISRDLVNRQVWTFECGINLTHKQLYITYYVKSRTKEFITYSKTLHTWASAAIGRSF